MFTAFRQRPEALCWTKCLILSFLAALLVCSSVLFPLARWAWPVTSQFVVYNLANDTDNDMFSKSIANTAKSIFRCAREADHVSCTCNEIPHMSDIRCGQLESEAGSRHSLRRTARHALAKLQPSSAGVADGPRHLFWIHIPKNGGTFVEEQLLKHPNITARSLLKIACWFPYEEIPCSGFHQPLSWMFQLAEQDHVSSRTRSQLFAMFRHLDAMTEIVAVLRHPYERAVSQWFFFGRRMRKDVNFYIQDALVKASGPCISSSGRKIAHVENIHLRIGGPFHEDCHWVSQASYVFTAGRDKQIVHRLIWQGNLTRDLNRLLRAYGLNVLAPFRDSRRTALTVQKLHEKTLRLLDAHYAEDFHLFGFRQLRGRALSQQSAFAPLKLSGGTLSFNPH